MSGGEGDQHDGEKHAGYMWLLICVVGMVSSLTLYGVVLEYVTSGSRSLHELSFLFVTTSVYSLTAYLARWLFNEPTNDAISKYQMLTLSITSIASTYTSVRSLRYVIYPVQILFKSCKPVPVMIFGKILGKKYSLQKYVNVVIITSGVALFMAGGSSASKEGSSLGSDSMFVGALMLSISLCFDGATGAYEDKLMGSEHVGPFDLMFNIQLGKAVISFIALVVTNSLGSFISTVQDGGLMLIILGFTGALGQIFVFVTISKFGALNCALIGLFRKILSLLLSFVLYKHSINAVQTVGLVLALAAMIANFYEKGGSKHKPAEPAHHHDEKPLLAPDQEMFDEDEASDGEVIDDAPADGGKDANKRSGGNSGRRPKRSASPSASGRSESGGVELASRGDALPKLQPYSEFIASQSQSSGGGAAKKEVNLLELDEDSV